MTVRIPGGSGQKSEAWTVDFRETAPRLTNETMFVADPLLARSGGLSVCIPGELRGLEEAHRRWGRLPWKTLVEPNIALAKGWRIGSALERRMQVSFFSLLPGKTKSHKSFSNLLLTNPDWSAVFAPHGNLLKEGDIIRRPNLARTLSYIAKQGPGVFYKVWLCTYL
jgi:gamma-glutamyltranspeptidase/glutathione hydrolase/leukotriene-C4 hydrolase